MNDGSYPTKKKNLPIRGMVSGETEITWAVAKFLSPDGRKITFSPSNSPWIAGETSGYNDFYMGLSRQERFDDLWDALCALYTKWNFDISPTTVKEVSK